MAKLNIKYNFGCHNQIYIYIYILSVQATNLMHKNYRFDSSSSMSNDINRKSRLMLNLFTLASIKCTYQTALELDAFNIRSYLRSPRL